jgi:flavin reductase (DIM6/NTAB) family NADH-FMN oxidoreductase RutF
MNISDSEILQLDKFYRRNLINSFTGFKSLTLVGTKSKLGISNLALFSQVFHVGATPPYIGILFRPHVVPRHTFENIIETGYFTINQVHTDIVEQAHQTSARYDISEFEATGLSEEYLDSYDVPLVKESRVKAICELNERVDIQSNGTHLIVGLIKEMIYPEEIAGADGFLELEKAGSLTVSGLDSYHTTEQIARLAYAKPDRELNGA